MKRNQEFERSCCLCEHSEELFGGDYYICKKKGIMDPQGHCSAYCFDPLKIKVTVKKIPKFTPFFAPTEEKTDEE